MDGIIGFATGNVLPDIINQDTTKQPETVSADRPYAFSKVLGRSIPIVIGTGKVDGIPVIGGAVTTQVSTGSNSVANPDVGSGIIGFSTGGGFLPDIGAVGPVQVPIYATQQIARLGYLLAFDPFGDGYQLVRLEINDQVVYDAEHGIGASAPFRFYGGNHTAVDPITTANIGANAGAWKHFAMVYIDGFAASSAPTVKAVISNAADVDPAASVPITGTYSEQSYGEDLAAYDPTTGLIYQFADNDMLYTLSVDDRSEMFGVRWPAAIPVPESFVALPDTGYVLASSFKVGPSYPVGLVNTLTGALVATTAPSGSKSWEAIAWFLALDAGAAGPGKFLVLGQYLTVQISPTDDANAAIAICNTAAGTIEIIDLAVTYDGWNYACKGRVTPVSASFFIVEWEYSNGEFGNTKISEIVWDGTSVSVNEIYNVPAGYARGIWYDPQTGYLVIPADNSGTHSIYIVNPQTGTLIKTISTPHNFDIANYQGYQVSNRLFPSFGSAFLIERNERAVYVLNLSSFSLVKYADFPGSDPELGIYDQSRNSWLEAFNADDTHWSVHQSAIATPLAVPLSEILAKLWFLAGYGPSELTFDGFTGLAATEGCIVMKNTFFDPANSPREYAIQGRGGCLEPLVPEGSITYISGAMAPTIGDNVCVYFDRRVFSEGGNIRHKLLIDMSTEAVTLRQLKPLQTLTFRRSAILAIHKVFAIQTPDGLIWDLRAAEGRQHFASMSHIGAV
jgi:hypothetical protein